MTEDLNLKTIRGCDLLLDLVVKAIACFTIAFYISLLFGLHRDIFLLLGMGIFLTGCYLTCKNLRKNRDANDPPALTSSQNPSLTFLFTVLLIISVCLAWLQIDGLQWPLIWLVLFGVLFLSARNAWRTEPTSISSRRRETSRIGTLLVITVALLSAFLSLIMVRPDQDDVFLVNRSTWVSEHASELPDRDTVFSDNTFPSERPSVVPTSIEPLIGALAAHLPITAAALTYFGWGPLIAALGVLSTWRLLRGMGARSPALATLVGTAFLIVDGEMHASFGNFFAGRSWQGKAVLLLLVIPALWHHGANWGRTGERHSLNSSILAGIAGIGLSSSAVFLIPVVTIAAVGSTAIEQRKLGRLKNASIVILPSIVAGFFALLSEPQKLLDPLGVLGSIDAKKLLDSGNEPINVLRMVFDEGATTFIILVCVFTAWMTVRDRSVRLLLLSAPIAVFVCFFAPGVLDLMNEIGQADAVAWRVLWILPLPAMVGLVLTALRAGIRAAPVLLTAIVFVVFSVFGTPITSSMNRDVEIVWPPSYDLPQPEQQSASSLIDIAGPGGVVAGPENVDFSVSVMTTKVRSINPRSAYLTGRHAGEEFRSNERLILSRGLETGRSEYGAESFENALRVLSPDAVCLKDTKEEEVAEVLINVGYKEIGNDGFCRIWVE